jgi:hypothetical protein
VDEDLTRANWRKSTYSNGSGGDCIECAELSSGRIAVRDTKDRGRGPVLVFDQNEWIAFVQDIRAGNFD